MKITKITQQVKRKRRYSVFVDEIYSFGLSENGLLDSGIAIGQELDEAKLQAYKLLSDNDKLYGLALRYAAMRPRSAWEMQLYMKRKDFPAPLIEQITNKLTRIGMLDDAKFAEMFVHDRRLLRSSSKRKIQLELQKKHIASETIQQALGEDETDEPTMLKDIITRKRQQSKFREDDLKLMQYLARQGFGYGDIKHALEELAEEA
ncbi:RecX family transcriptional regulator [Aeromicrobium sp.]|nr:RecX family transcriptional regulator [Candidatus Saccharibacteria bacterium]